MFFLSDGFTSMAVINPPERKLANAPLCTAMLDIYSTCLFLILRDFYIEIALTVRTLGEINKYFMISQKTSLFDANY